MFRAYLGNDQVQQAGRRCVDDCVLMTGMVNCTFSIIMDLICIFVLLYNFHLPGSAICDRHDGSVRRKVLDHAVQSGVAVFAEEFVRVGCSVQQWSCDFIQILSRRM